MSTRAYSLLVVVGLGVCAYGAGWLLGREVEQRWEGRGGRSKSPALGAAVLRGGGRSGGGGTNEAGGIEVAGVDTDPAKMLQRVLEVLRAADRARNWDLMQEQERLSPMLFFLSAKEFPVLWEALKELKSSEMRESLQKGVLYRWSHKDPQAALAAALKLPASTEKDYAVNSVLTTWAEQDPGAALARARELPEGGRRNQAVAFVLLGIAERDPKAAAQLLSELPAGRDHDWASERIFEELAPLDLEGAMAMFNPRDEQQREHKLWTAAELRCKRSLPEALAWAQGLKDEQERQTALGAVMHVMAKSQLQEAIDFAQSQSDPKERDRLMGAVTWSWAQEDVQAALAWVSQLPEGALRNAAWDGMRNLADRETAIKFTLASVPSGQKRSRRLEYYASDWIGHAKPGEDQAVLQFAEGLAAGSDRDAFLCGLCDGMAKDFPEQAARLAVTIGAEQSQAKAVGKVVESWVGYDPAAAAAWSAALPQSPARVEAFSEVIFRWADLEPAAAAKWLQGLPDDAARAAAAGRYFSLTIGQRTELATQALALIPDAERRNELIEKTARDWLKDDRESARAWLEQTSLPAERKEQLLKR